LPIENDYRGHRIEVNAVHDEGVWDAVPPMLSTS
jgi:hypothetical protein